GCLEDEAFQLGHHGRRRQTRNPSDRAFGQSTASAASEETLSHGLNTDATRKKCKKLMKLAFSSSAFHPCSIRGFFLALKEKYAVKCQILAFLAVAFLVAADTPKDGAVKKEADMLQGTWRVASAERDGMPAPEDEIKKITVSIKGDKLTARRTENAEK